MIGDREGRLLEYLVAPHSLDEIATHRFVYRPSASDVRAASERAAHRSFHAGGLGASSSPTYPVRSTVVSSALRSTRTG